MLRTIIVIAFVVIFLILSIPVWGVLAIIGIFNKPLKDEIGFAIVKGAFHIVWWLAGVKPVVTGLDKVPDDKAVLFVGNHASYFDVVLGYSLCPHVTGFLSKKDFAKVPLLSVWMKMLYCIFLTRDDPRTDLKLIMQATENVKNGISMFVFPEGTRSKTGEMAEFHSAVLKISTKNDAPIIPVAFTGTRNIFENQAPAIKRSTVYITYGDPIIPSQLEPEDKKKIGPYIQNVVKEMLEADKIKYNL